MIELRALAKKLEEELNKVASGAIEYKIFTDTGKFLKASRSGNTIITYINGLYTNSTSDISNVFNSADTEDGGLKIATMTNVLSLAIPCLDDEDSLYKVYRTKEKTTIKDKDGNTKQVYKDVEEEQLIEIGTADFLAEIRKELDAIASKNLFFTQDGYDVSVSFSLADSGTREQLPELGDCFTFSVDCYYNIIQGGDNSRNWLIYLDGELLPYSSISFSRNATTETTTYINRGRNTSTMVVADTFAIGIEIPSLFLSFNDTVKDYLFNGDDGNAHFLQIIAGKTTDGNASKTRKLVIFTSDTMTASGVLNVGNKIQLNETNEEYGLTTFDETKYKIYYAQSATGVVSGLSGGEYAAIYHNTDGVYKFYSITGGVMTATIAKGDLLIVLRTTDTTNLDSTIWAGVVV